MEGRHDRPGAPGTSAGLGDLEHSRLSVLASRALADDAAGTELDELLATLALTLDVPFALLLLTGAERPWRTTHTVWPPDVSTRLEHHARAALGGTGARTASVHAVPQPVQTPGRRTCR